jgi:hypothetical protein
VGADLVRCKGLALALLQPLAQHQETLPRIKGSGVGMAAGPLEPLSTDNRRIFY